MKIARVHWAEITEARPSWSSASGRLYAIWPSPIDHDACFAAAGFSDFGDSDEAWDAEFAEFVEKTLAVLGEIGKARGGPRASLRDALIAAARDDNFPPCVVSFGEPVVASVRTSDGHPILWIWIATGGLDALLPRIVASRESAPHGDHDSRRYSQVGTGDSSTMVGLAASTAIR